jgi:hypothetical protein
VRGLRNRADRIRESRELSAHRMKLLLIDDARPARLLHCAFEPGLSHE